MLGIERVARFDTGDELDGHDARALMQQLEHRMLRIRPHAAPGDRGALPPQRRAVRRHRFTVRFHFELLEIARQQPQPLVIGKDRARRTAARLRIKQIDKCREDGGVFTERCQPEMPVHLGRAFEQFLEIAPAQRQRRRKSDRGPERIAPANGFIKGEHARFIDAPRNGRVWIGGQRNHATHRIGNPVFLHPLQDRCRIQHRFGRRERLGGNDEQCRRRVEARKRFLKCAAIDVRDNRNIIPARIAAQRVDDQVRPQRRPTDPDMQDMTHRPQRIALDRIDQRAHPAVQRARFGNAFGRALATFGAMFGRAAFTRVDDTPAEQVVALGGKPRLHRQPLERRQRICRQMRLRKIEQYARLCDRQTRQPVGIARKQRRQRFMRQCVNCSPVVHYLSFESGPRA